MFCSDCGYVSIMHFSFTAPCGLTCAVRSFGTEDRPVVGLPLPARDGMYDLIVVQGSDIVDLHVVADAPAVSVNPCDTDDDY